MDVFSYKLPSNEVFKELMELAQKNGWLTHGVSKRKNIWRNKRTNENYIQIDNGYTSFFGYDDQLEGKMVTLKQARKILSTKIEWVKHFPVYQRENGLQIGCTFFPRKALERIYYKFTEKPIMINDAPVKFGQDETGEGIIKYVRYGSRYLEKDIEKLAKIAGITLD